MDSIFKAIWNNKSDLFWKIHCKSNPVLWNISDELKELILMMFSIDPFYRPSIAEISRHPWWLLPCDKTEVENEISWKIENNYKIPEEEVKAELEMKFADIFETCTTRGKSPEGIKLGKYIDAIHKTTLSKVFSSSSEEDLFWLVTQFLKTNSSLELEVDTQTFKMSFKEKNDETKLNGYCSILSVSEQVRCVMFTNLSHPGRRKFVELFKEFKKFMGGHIDVKYSSIFN